MKNFSVYSGLKYYLSSIPKILFNMNFWEVLKLPFNTKVRININNKLFFDVRNLLDVWTLKEVLIDNVYRLERQNKLETVLDIGSALGDFSILASKISRKVYAFDLDPELVVMMKRNLLLNGIKNVVVEKKKVNSLDEVFKRCSIKKCDLLKIDCEGAEYEIFRNSKDSTLRKISKITFEIHLFNNEYKVEFNKLKHRLIKLGFKLEEISNPVHPNLKYLYASFKN